MIRNTVRRPALVLLASLFGLFTSFVLSMGLTHGPAISLGNRVGSGPSMFTDSRGHFYFSGLHDSSHLLRLDMQTLPADLHPAGAEIAMTLSPGVTQALKVAPGVVLQATYS